MLFFDPVLRGVFGGDLASASEILADDTGIELLIARLEETRRGDHLGRLSRPGARCRRRSPRRSAGSMTAVTREPRAFLALDRGRRHDRRVRAHRARRRRAGASIGLARACRPRADRRRASSTVLGRAGCRAADPRARRRPLGASAPSDDAGRMLPRLEVAQPRAAPAGGRGRLRAGARARWSTAASRSGWRIASAQRRDDRPARDVATPARRRASTRSSSGPAIRRRPTSARALARAGGARRGGRATAGPELTVVLAGGMAEQLGAFGDVADRPGEVAARRRRRRQRRGGGGPLADLLIELALPADDPRRALGPATAGARRRPRPAGRGRRDRLRRRRARAAATPSAGGRRAPALDLAIVADGRRSPRPTPTTPSSIGVARLVDRRLDRHRLRDRLRELRIAPVGRRDRRRGRPPAWPPPGPPSAVSPTRRPSWADRPARRPRRRHRRGLGGRAGAGRRARPRRRPAPAGRRPVRARPRAAPRRRSARSPTRTSGGR